MLRVSSAQYMLEWDTSALVDGTPAAFNVEVPIAGLTAGKFICLSRLTITQYI